MGSHLVAKEEIKEECEGTPVNEGRPKRPVKPSYIKQSPYVSLSAIPTTGLISGAQELKVLDTSPISFIVPMDPFRELSEKELEVCMDWYKKNSNTKSGESFNSIWQTGAWVDSLVSIVNLFSLSYL